MEQLRQWLRWNVLFQFKILVGESDSADFQKFWKGHIPEQWIIFLSMGFWVKACHIISPGSSFLYKNVFQDHY